MKKLVLIDGLAIIHRAYHALPSLNSKDGKPTNAVYGFFTMLLKIINDLKPEYLAVCFDLPKPTFRQELYAGYQGHRPEMESDMSDQIVILHEILDKSGIRYFEIEGYEADDLIGTISVESVNQDKDLSVIIVSGDRDLLQLVNHRVLVLAPIIGITKMILFDEVKVKEKYGLKPNQIIDYKALVGDPSDNYPGISGVGPKTASELLNKYGNFEELYKNLGDIPEKLAKKLAEDIEQASLARKLATIACDAPLNFKLEDTDSSKIDINALKKSFEELGFKSILKRLDEIKKNKEEAANKKKEEKEKNKNEQLGLL